MLTYGNDDYIIQLTGQTTRQAAGLMKYFVGSVGKLVSLFRHGQHGQA
jgi:hypothetical protein